MQMIEFKTRVVRTERKTKDGGVMVKHLQMMSILDDEGRGIGSYKMEVPNEVGTRPGIYELGEFCWETGDWGVAVLARDLPQVAEFKAATWEEFKKGPSKPRVAAE